MLPHSRCNFILERILIGAKPIKETLNQIINCGVNVFVNLCSNQKTELEYPDHCHIIHFPIQPGKASPIKKTKELIELLYSIWLDNNNFLYIHCEGGHGRSGMFGALLYGKIQKVSAPIAIQAIVNARENRFDKSRNFIPTPETNSQVKLIVSILGTNLNEEIPDRSDLSWLKKKCDSTKFY